MTTPSFGILEWGTRILLEEVKPSDLSEEMSSVSTFRCRVERASRVVSHAAKPSDCMKRLPTASTVADEETARREIESQAAFTMRKVQILAGHAALNIAQAEAAGPSASPASEMESRRIESLVRSSCANLTKIREAAAAHLEQKHKDAAAAPRKASRYELEILRSRQHVASFTAQAALRNDEATQRACIEKSQSALRGQLVRLYLKNLTKGLQNVKVAGGKAARGAAAVQ